MKTTENNSEAIKQALRRKQTEQLPANFTIRLMESIHHEAVKQQKRRDCLLLFSISGTVLLLVGLLIGYFALYTSFSWRAMLPDPAIFQQGTATWRFYTYIALLTALLLGADYRLRKRRAQKEG